MEVMVEIKVWQTRPGRRWKLSRAWPFLSKRNKKNVCVHVAWWHPRWGDFHGADGLFSLPIDDTNERFTGYNFSPKIRYPENAEIGES